MSDKMEILKDFMKVDYIRTYTGIDFTVFDPKVEQICIEDIAHALSHLCRYGGHCDHFYSVAQHSIAVSYLVEPQNALCGLMHDATEAYLVDMPRPIKYKINQYREIEDKLHLVIAEKYQLPKVIPDDVHMIDSLMIKEFEWDYFMEKRPQEKYTNFYKRFFENKNPKEVREEFLKRFTELSEIREKKSENFSNNIPRLLFLKK